jgi:hypothetical protein
MAVRKTTTTTVTGPREYALSKGKVVGTTQSRITITRSSPNYGKAIDLLKLPVFMLLFWLLVLAPFFTVMTTIQDGKIILADAFNVNYGINISPGESLYDITYLNNSLQTIGTGIYGVTTNSEWSFTNKIEIQNNDIIFYGYENVTIIWFYNSNSEIIKTYRSQLISSTWPFQTSRPSTWDNSFIPQDAVYFAFASIKISQTSDANKPDLISFATFQTIEPAYSQQTIFVSQNNYYDIMENARTAQYGNPFEFVNFLLQLPNMVGNSKPLAFLGIDASFSDMNQQVLEIRASGYQGLLDLFKVLNPVRWFE